MRHKSGKKRSSEHGNAATHLLKSALFNAVSTLVMFLEADGWLTQIGKCLSWHAATWTMNLVGLR